MATALSRRHLHRHLTVIVVAPRCHLRRLHLSPDPSSSSIRRASFGPSTSTAASDRIAATGEERSIRDRPTSSSSTAVPPRADMRLRSAAPLLAALSLAPSAASFRIGDASSSRRAAARGTRSAGGPSSSLRRRASSAAPDLRMADVAEADLPAAAAPANPSSGGGGSIAEGRILSLLSGPTSSFAVVKVGEDDADVTSWLPSSLSATGAGISGGEDGSVPLVAGDAEEDKVELASALFAAKATAAAKKDNGVSGDLTGRTVTFSDSSSGVVVAHRHPVAFVLLDSAAAGLTADAMGDAEECSVSSEPASLDPSSVPAGSTVDYLGRHVAVLGDGSVGRTLPRAADGVMGMAVGQMDAAAVAGIGILDAQITDSQVINGAGNDRRPIFVPIPKISDIGLIDSPLVTGITAIDALTPIGKGQNMLVIGPEEEDDGASAENGAVNKRRWMINLLRNVVENHRGHKANEDPLVVGGKGVRCFYGLTSGDVAVRASVLKGIEKAGIEDDVVTVVSTYDSAGGANSGALEAAEAVAVAASACTLAEHHAVTAGGDSVVIIDDVNLHKSLWDITTRELVSVYGADAVVAADLNGGSSSEMRGFFSGLIQRAARFNAKKGGGSVTLMLLSTLPGPDVLDPDEVDEEEPVFEASDFDSMSQKIQDRISLLVKAKVPLTPTSLAKIQIPVPRPSAAEDARRLAHQHVDDLVSMSDGQIWLDSDLAKQGRSPPLDPTKSLTRVGVGADTLKCRADAPALRGVAGSLRFEFQQAADAMENTSNAVGGASANDRQSRRRDAFLLAMDQAPDERRRLCHEVVALLAAAGGHLD
eukprot:CAMPEP_0172527696 /NCGR_PEP_ID=MMETSP1067-20121228/2322_1 /TAXON_ID=265564 ORGANISM="Thalassiosira punctigera, Strain Tpunct2005C2" /NCGR_SAMPLE_ID=MMETSP1067 /ASSEMBLY_ACC=CAM_ASM_000444 /LENGTH=819 /DNA_ID=CAMNT_0013311489 /DNA_START=1 /DNA_END=2457 /DNA_ORIENTATION=+